MSYRISSETIHGMEESKNIISDHTETISFGCASHLSSWDNDSVMSCNNDFDEGHKTCIGYRMKSSYRCSTDGHEVISGRRAEHRRKLSRGSNDAAYMLGHSKRFNQARKENSCSTLQDVQKNVRNACIHGGKSAKSLNQAWKENSRSILQEVQKNVTNACIQGGKRSNPNHVQIGIESIYTQEAALLVNHKSFSTGAVLPSPVISSFKQNCTSKEVKDIWNNEQGDQTNGLILNESPQRVSQERFHGHAGPYFVQSGQNGIQKNKLREKSKAKMNQLPKHENSNHLKKLSQANKENLYRHKTEMNLPEAESLEASSKTYVYRTDNFDCLPFIPVSSAHLQQNVPYSRIEGPSDKALREVGSPTWMNIARMYASVGSLHLYSDNEENKSTCYEIELSYEDDVREDFKSRPSLQKWIPVGRKDSSTLKNKDVVDKPILFSLKSETHQEATSLNHGSIYKNSSMNNQKLLSYDVPTELRIESEMLEFDKLGDQGKCTDQTRKVDPPSDSVTMNIPLLPIGSQKAEQALNEAYRLQIASESVQAATGSPLAEFERLLHSASPVIVPAYVPKRCEKCSGNQNCLKSLCEHQVPKIPLIALWNWYEQPGSYGLEVKAEDSECFNVIGTHEICFHAHFVPFLSAVQLFGHSCDSKSSRAGGLVSEVVKENHAAEQLPYPISLDMKCIEVVGTKPFESSVPILFDPTKNRRSSNVLDSNSHASSKHIKLIFEFFETEQPQQRKPLYDKIMELTKTGTSCGQVFGDASNLKCLNLQDLHPASWYSVAWYPIYRIPEGNLRASFLTYHSLGHLSQRCISTADHFGEKAFCVVCPALGLQSYNTQGECWFNPKKHSYSSSKESAPSNTSDILMERLRTLEEAALLFARGYVYKGNVKVANHQPDYEFFLSRKH